MKGSFLGIQQRRSTVVLRYLLSVYTFLVENSYFSGSSQRLIRLPSPGDMSKRAGISSAQHWRLCQKLVSTGVLQIVGSGSSSRYEIRTLKKFLKYFEQTYLAMAGNSVYLPYVLPRSFASLNSREERLAEMFSRLQEAKLSGDVALVLHTALNQRKEQRQVFRSRQLELILEPNQLEPIEAALSLSRILPLSAIRSDRPFLQNCDVVVVCNRLNSFVMENCLRVYDQWPVVCDLINYFELSRYPKRGSEGAEVLHEDLRLDQVGM